MPPAGTGPGKVKKPVQGLAGVGVGRALPGKGRLNQFPLLPDQMQRGVFGRGRRSACPGRTPLLQDDMGFGNDRNRGSLSAVTGHWVCDFRLLNQASGWGSIELADR